MILSIANVIKGEPDSGINCLNGAAARMVQINDKIIIISFAIFDENKLLGFEPVIVHVDDQNRPI